MRSHNHPIILFIDRSGFSIFQDTQPNIPRFNFTPDLVANLDVINKEQFSNLIATFIQINKIVPSSLGIILSDNIVYFKDLISLQKQTSPNQPLSNPAPDIQNFLEDVPFEEILAKVIKTDQLNRIVAVNKDLVMTIADVFVNKGSTIDAVIPSFLYGPAVNFTLGLTQDNIRIILAGSEILKIGNLLTDQEKASSPQSLESEKKNPQSGGEKKPQNLRQYILVGVFVTLLVILAVVYLNLGASQTLPVKKIKSSSLETVSAPSIAPTAIPALTSAPVVTSIPVDLKNIKVKITHASNLQDIASNLKDQLVKAGFADITDEISTTSSPEKSSVIFSQNIPSNLRDNLTSEIKKILPSVSILENQDINLTIAIILGKS